MPASCLARVASCSSYLLSRLSQASSCASVKLWRRATGHAAVAQGIDLIPKDNAAVHEKNPPLWLAAASLQCKISGCWLSPASVTHLYDRCIELVGATAHGPQVSTSQT